jgi:hypothetical protein
VLDALLDAYEPLSVSRILAEMPPGTSRNSGESAIKREFDAGRIERVAPGIYRLAPPKPPEAPKPPPPAGSHADDEWIARIEAWQADPTTWNVEEDGPPPNDPNHRIPLDVVGRFKDRLRKRDERRRDAEAAASRQAAADADLRNKLISACNGNFTSGPGIEDIAPIKAALELIPLDLILSVIRWKVCKLCCPANATLTSWRDPRILRAIAKEFCESIIIPNSVDAWAAAGTAPQKPVERVAAAPAVQVPPKPKKHIGGGTVTACCRS